MISVPDFTDKEYDEWNDKTRERLTETLRNIFENATSNIASTEVNFPKGTIFHIADDTSVVIPKGYKKADGTSGTYDASSKPPIPIQKI